MANDIQWHIHSPGTNDNKKKSIEITLIRFTAYTQKNPHDQFIFLKSATGIDGTLAGVGEEENIATILTQLAAAEKEGNLPKRINLYGFSRGAVQNIELANRIYEIYGDKIKINMTANDPIAGPNRGYGDNKIFIPPNVDSMIVVYFQEEDKVGYKAQDFGSRIIAYDTSKTTITTIGIPRNHYNQVKNPGDVGMSSKLAKYLEISHARNAMDIKLDDLSHYNETLEQTDMQGVGSRAGSDFALVTPIDSNLLPSIKNMHENIRNFYKTLPAITTKEPDEALKQMPKDTPEARKAYKEACIDKEKNVNRNLITKGEKLAVALHFLTAGFSTMLYNLNDAHRTRSKGFTIGLSLLTLNMLPLIERVSIMVKKHNKSIAEPSAHTNRLLTTSASENTAKQVTELPKSHKP